MTALKSDNVFGFVESTGKVMSAPKRSLHFGGSSASRYGINLRKGWNTTHLKEAIFFDLDVNNSWVLFYHAAQKTSDQQTISALPYPICCRWR